MRASSETSGLTPMVNGELVRIVRASLPLVVGGGKRGWPGDGAQPARVLAQRVAQRRELGSERLRRELVRALLAARLAQSKRSALIARSHAAYASSTLAPPRDPPDDDATAWCARKPRGLVRKLLLHALRHGRATGGGGDAEGGDSRELGARDGAHALRALAQRGGVEQRRNCAAGHRRVVWGAPPPKCPPRSAAAAAPEPAVVDRAGSSCVRLGEGGAPAWVRNVASRSASRAVVASACAMASALAFCHFAACACAAATPVSKRRS